MQTLFSGSAFIIRIFLNSILPEFKRNYSCSVFNDSGVFYLAFNDGITQKKLSKLILEDGNGDLALEKHNF